MFMVLGQRWDFFPPAIWCATKDSGEPKSHLIHTAIYDQFDKQNLFEDSHWLIFAHGLVPANIVVAWAAWVACIHGSTSM